MLDIELIRKERALVAEGLSRRLDAGVVSAVLDDISDLDQRRRALIQKLETERQQRKANARRYAQAKAQGTTDLAPPAADREVLAALEAELQSVGDELRLRISELPNLPADDVVAGGKENNRVLKTFGRKPELKDGKDHVALARDLELVDFERGVKLGGSGFWIYTGLGARLEMALINWFIDQHVKAGYQLMLPPHLLLESAGFAAGQFPKFRDEVFHIEAEEGSRGRFLLPTSETAILGAYQDEVVDYGQLPIKAAAYTPCYRLERAGSHSDERGTVRGHQFNKVEIFQFVEPGRGPDVLEEMLLHAESLVEGLGLHYQRSLLAAGDASASMRKTIDIEVWMPSAGKYKEVSSVSWAGDYQARRAGIRFREPAAKATTFLETLNGSALATSRIFPAILEQYQLPDGSVEVPEVLRPGVGVDRIVPPVRA
jgi:seryl-tRNA synthetase